jgi:zinc protease
VRQRETIDGRANELGEAQIIEGSAAQANDDIDELEKVTAADVRRVAAKYLVDDQRAVIRYLPESEKPPGAPAAPPAPPPAASQPFTGAVAALAPEQLRQAPPPIGAQPPAILPTPVERTLANGLRVIVARSSDAPLVSANLVIKTGAAGDPSGLSGTADLTADLVTAGTATRSARDIASQSEALGASLAAASGWESSSVSLSVTRDKLGEALPIMADVAEGPAFAPDELERARKEALDGLQVAYDNPSQIAGFATAPVVYAGTPFAHASNGTPMSLKRVTRADLAGFHDAFWRPDNAILVLTGDITPELGFAQAERVFGGWKRPPAPAPLPSTARAQADPRVVAIDLPGAAQADVVVTETAITRTDPRYYQGLVANAVLGGGYSARLNEEIRVKRGLSYGASSSLTSRRSLGAFTAQVETRNEATGQVVGLIDGEMTKLGAAPATADELAARKSSLVGEYGRAIATSEGLAEQLANLALYGIDLAELQRYTDKVQAVSAADVQAFAHDAFDPARASVIVVGDAKAFLPTLKPTMPTLDVIPITAFDPDTPTLKAAAAP